MDQYRTTLWDLKLSCTLQQLIKLLSTLKERFEDFFEVVSMFDILSPVHFFDKDINEKVEEDLSVSPSDLCIEYDLFRNVLKTIGLNSELANPRNTYQFFSALILTSHVLILPLCTNFFLLFLWVVRLPKDHSVFWRELKVTIVVLWDRSGCRN